MIITFEKDGDEYYIDNGCSYGNEYCYDIDGLPADLTDITSKRCCWIDGVEYYAQEIFLDTNSEETHGYVTLVNPQRHISPLEQPVSRFLAGVRPEETWSKSGINDMFRYLKANLESHPELTGFAFELLKYSPDYPELIKAFDNQEPVGIEVIDTFYGAEPIRQLALRVNDKYYPVRVQDVQQRHFEINQDKKPDVHWLTSLTSKFYAKRRKTTSKKPIWHVKTAMKAFVKEYGLTLQEFSNNFETNYSKFTLYAELNANNLTYNYQG